MNSLFIFETEQYILSKSALQTSHSTRLFVFHFFMSIPTETYPTANNQPPPWTSVHQKLQLEPWKSVTWWADWDKNAVVWPIYSWKLIFQQWRHHVCGRWDEEGDGDRKIKVVLKEQGVEAIWVNPNRRRLSTGSRHLWVFSRSFSITCHHCFTRTSTYIIIHHSVNSSLAELFFLKCGTRN